ncbi:hypothetical protein ACFSR7_17260 [Cohnella sp. GCM10020058]
MKNATVIGIAYPREDTPWRLLSGKIKQVWNQHEEQAKGEALFD